MNTGLKPAWAGRALRLDPTRFPQYVTYAPKDGTGEVTVTLARQGAVIKRRLEQSRLPFSIALPGRAFLGVAARAVEDDDGNVVVTLELMHVDPALCVPLLVSCDLSDIEADWRAWARAYDLPMLMIEADGTPYPLPDRLDTSTGRAPAPRRRGAGRNGLRMRRGAGHSPRLRLVISGEEIIPRGV